MCKRLIYLTSFVLVLVAVSPVTHAQVDNLLQNPSFEEDGVVLDNPNWEQWTTWNPAEGAGSNAAIVDTEFIDGTRSLRVDPRGGTDWYFVVLQDFISRSRLARSILSASGPKPNHHVRFQRSLKRRTTPLTGAGQTFS